MAEAGTTPPAPTPTPERSLCVLDEKVDAARIIAEVDTLAAEPRLALDLEADSFHRYVERVCLLQIGTRTTDVLYDPITHGLPEPVRALLSSPERTWVLHGGDYDILSLQRDFGLALGRVLDTQIAARFLGRPGLGLQALLEGELGIRIGKGEQRSDWRRRPLSLDQVRYARQDVAHLLPLADRLVAELEACGRRSWVEEECELLRVRLPQPKVPDPDACLKLKGARDLPDAGRAVVRAVHDWREAVAQARDRAPFRILAPESIVPIAHEALKRGPLPADELRRWRGIAHDVDTKPLAEAIARGLRTPAEGRAQRRPGPPPPAQPPGIRARVDVLRQARVGWAEPLGLEPSLLLPPALIEAVAALPTPSPEVLQVVPGMTRWRYEVLAGSLLTALGSR